MTIQNFHCFLVSQVGDGPVTGKLTEMAPDDLPAGAVLIKSAWSSLNYKDALAVRGHPGVAGKLPHVPGIDVAGTVESSTDSRYQPGDSVLVTGYELGAPAWGGWSEYVRVPADWVVPLPSTLTLRESMVLGTAGFTAAQCVLELERNEILPASGPIVVTGATGGVGSWAVRMLGQLGYQVHAITGKNAQTEALKALGAAEVLAREELSHDPKRPLAKSRWAGGIDTVGGEMLVALLKSTHINGCVAACGLVSSDKLNMTVYPFILRGTKLVGVTSSSCPRPVREQIWARLSGPKKVDMPDEWVEEISLDGLSDAVKRIQKGHISGRVVVRIAAS